MFLIFGGIGLIAAIMGLLCVVDPGPVTKGDLATAFGCIAAICFVLVLLFAGVL